jgi:tripartite-type tricarboxylate transporter receptor subunit TctC
MYLTKAKRALGLAILAAALPLAVLAQGYPLRPITVIVVFAAGGPSDTIARLLSDDFVAEVRCHWPRSVIHRDEVSSSGGER